MAPGGKDNVGNQKLSNVGVTEYSLTAAPHIAHSRTTGLLAGGSIQCTCPALQVACSGTDHWVGPALGCGRTSTDLIVFEVSIHSPLFNSMRCLWLCPCLQVMADVWSQFLQLYPSHLAAAAAAAAAAGVQAPAGAKLTSVNQQQWQQQLLADRYDT